MSLEQFTLLLDGSYDPQGVYPKVSVGPPWGVADRMRCEVCGHMRSVVTDDAYGKSRATIDGPSFPKEEQDAFGLVEPVFSERMVSQLVEANVTGFVPHKVSVWRTVAPGETVIIPDLEVYWLEITGEVEADLQIFNNGEDNICSNCGKWSPKEENGDEVFWGDEVLASRLGSWDGSDLCRYTNVGVGGFLCSRKVVELHAKHSWKGFCFQASAIRLTSKIKPDENPNWLVDLEEQVRRKYPEHV